MVPSSAFCRAQEDLHLRRAADATLDNVRRVATGAAAAWSKEAVAAEQREARQARLKANAAVAEQAVAAEAERRDAMTANENPDHGLAQVGRTG